MNSIGSRARCLTCRSSWSGADALERATEHAGQERHHVKGLRQQALDLDGGRPSSTQPKENT